eukprot:scaffold5632_cov146-Skeletonema_marinoi.AAC.5
MPITFTASLISIGLINALIAYLCIAISTRTANEISTIPTKRLFTTRAHCRFFTIGTESLVAQFAIAKNCHHKGIAIISRSCTCVAVVLKAIITRVVLISPTRKVDPAPILWGYVCIALDTADNAAIHQHFIVAPKKLIKLEISLPLRWQM